VRLRVGRSLIGGAVAARRRRALRRLVTRSSRWESEEAISAFSGSEDRTARLEPRDREFLLASEPEAEHNEVAIGVPVE
jgi:hypothetical protein